MTPLRIRQLFSTLQAANPEPQGELQYGNPFELLVAVILSAQATDKSVNAATTKLFPIANTPQDILALGEEGLIPFIRTIGLFRAKARHIVATCERLLTLHHGQVPQARSDLEALPGVGRKTANVVLNIAFNEPVIAVDTHIFRVANRTGLSTGKTVAAVEKGLDKVVPTEFKRHAHHWLILHGRYTCQARRPRCEECSISACCKYHHEQLKAP